MGPMFQEHDALIVGAARGILRRMVNEATDRLIAADPGDAYRLGRIAEALDRAEDAIANALIACEVRAGDVHARAARRGREADRPAPVEVQ